MNQMNIGTTPFTSHIFVDIISGKRNDINNNLTIQEDSFVDSEW